MCDCNTTEACKPDTFCTCQRVAAAVAAANTAKLIVRTGQPFTLESVHSAVPDLRPGFQAAEDIAAWILVGLLPGEIYEALRHHTFIDPSILFSLVVGGTQLANWIAGGNPPAPTWNTISATYDPELMISWQKRVCEEAK